MDEQTQTPKAELPRHKDDWSAKTLAMDFLTCFIAALLVSASLYYFSNYNGFASRLVPAARVPYKSE